MTATNICYNFVGFRCSPPLKKNGNKLYHGGYNQLDPLLFKIVCTNMVLFFLYTGTLWFLNQHNIGVYIF